MSSAQVSREGFVGVELRLPYRRDRDYIHSADIFQAITSLAQQRFSSEAYVDSLVLRRQAARQVRISFQAEPQTIGTFSIRATGEHLRGCLAETEAAVLDRVSYDESRAADAVVGGFGYACFTDPVAGYTAFEQMLVLLKAAGGLGNGEAWLCRTNLRGPLLDTALLAVRLRLRAMHRFHRFDILQNERQIGEAIAYLRSQPGEIVSSTITT